MIQLEGAKHNLIAYSGESEVLYITETWLADNITDGLVDSHHVVRHDGSNLRGSGICIQVSKNLDVVELSVSNCFPSLEIIHSYLRWCQPFSAVLFVSQAVLQCFVYRLHE